MDNMDTLKQNSIVIDEEAERELSFFNLSEVIAKYDGCYAINHLTIAFILNHSLYVTPYTREAHKTIINAGLAKGYFYVPYSGLKMPKHARIKWKQLRKAATDSYTRDYENDCIAWCDNNHIGKLTDETLKRCIRIPHKGVSIMRGPYESIVWPVHNECNFTHAVAISIGCFNAHNGIVVFIYRDGHTYITKGYWIIDKLIDAGYRKSNLYVPFSEDEQITNPAFKAEWENLK